MGPRHGHRHGPRTSRCSGTRTTRLTKRQAHLRQQTALRIQFPHFCVMGDSTARAWNVLCERKHSPRLHFAQFKLYPPARRGTSQGDRRSTRNVLSTAQFSYPLSLWTFGAPPAGGAGRPHGRVMVSRQAFPPPPYTGRTVRRLFRRRHRPGARRGGTGAQGCGWGSA